MRIIDIRERTALIAAPIANAVIDFSGMTLSLVAVLTDVVRNGRRVVGYGFNSNGRYGQGALIRERFAPRVLAADPGDLVDESGENLDPHRVWAAMMRNEKPGGHGERSVAVAAIDMAVWDAVAKIAERPLFRLVAERHGDGDPDPRVFVYAAGGYYRADDDLEELRDEMSRYIDLGYTVVKMKIGGAPLAQDVQRIEAVLNALPSGARLAVDANGRLDPPTALAYAEALEPYDLFWFEEPGDPLDFELQHAIAAAYAPPLATGENLFSMPDVRNLLRYGGMRPDRDWLQFDPGLSYGLVEYLRTMAMAREHDWSPARCIPHGGHQMALNIAAGLRLGGNESYPELFQPFGGFPDGVEVIDGHVTLPELPGIGFEGKAKLYAEMRSLAE